MSEPTVIQLDESNSLKIVVQYVEIAQGKGSFLLNEAEILKRASDVLVNNVVDSEINFEAAKNLLIQGINKGQSKGAYTLNDAALLCKAITVFSTMKQVIKQVVLEDKDIGSSDLSSLSDPIPVCDLSSLSDPIPLEI